MLKENVSIDEAIDLLNDMLRIDPMATNVLFCAAAPVNQALRDHPTIQVGGEPGYFPVVRLMGVINGIFGVDENVCGAIAAEYDNGRIIGFRRYKQSDPPEE